MEKKLYNKIYKRLQRIYATVICAMLYTPYIYVFGRKDKRKLKYNVSLCLIFNDEAPYLKEWLDYHLTIGVDHFYLYNDNSTDDYLSVLTPYINQGVVTLIQWEHRRAQAQCYRQCLETFRNETKWIGYIDADEFVCPLKTADINDWIKDYDRYPAVHIPWLQFGTSGLVNHDFSQNVIEQYFSCWGKYWMGKTFVNTRYEITNWDTLYFHHKSYMRYRVFGIPCSIPAVSADKIIRPMSGKESSKTQSRSIQINHYFTKAWDVYMAKMKKPDVYFDKNPKSYDKFFSRETKCVDRNYSILRFLQKMRFMQGNIK